MVVTRITPDKYESKLMAEFAPGDLMCSSSGKQGTYLYIKLSNGGAARLQDGGYYTEEQTQRWKMFHVKDNTYQISS